MIAFINTFLSYLLLFLIIVVLAIIAVFIGIRLRKNKDAKSAVEEETAKSS
ncbi:MAG: hypothetical protein ACI4DN_03125 [Lachnospiraceae bacterium]